MWSKHVPVRTCTGCGAKDNKRQLVRIVRTPAGNVEVDPTGRKAGRGAYLCTRLSCWEQALGKGRLERALHTSIPREERDVLLTCAQPYSPALAAHGGVQLG